MKKILLGVFLCALAPFSHGQSLEKKLTTAYSQFEADSQLRYGISSLTVLNAVNGQVIFSKNGGMGLAPASTLKTITSVTAFNLLGSDYTWETTLGYTGTINNSVLRGDLILSPGGDPSLGSSRYEQTNASLLLNRWLKAVKNAGIARVEGKVIVDDRLFGSQTLPVGWVWQDIGNYYGAGSTSATWKENQFALIIRAGAKVGDPVVFQNTEPEMGNLKLVNEVSTGPQGSGDNVYAYSAPYCDIVYVRGTYGIDLKKRIMLSMPDAAGKLAQDLNEKLASNGISVSGGALTARMMAVGMIGVPVVIDKYRSPELSKIVYWLNQKSINLYAENILKSLGLRQMKKGSTETGVEALTRFWTSKLGIDAGALDMIDGSGLSPEDRVTTMAMARILQSARNEVWFDSFYESLPLHNNMKMKSGSIRNVLAYTGYQKSSDGTPLVFSFITNHYRGSSASIRQKMFTVLDVLK